MSRKTTSPGAVGRWWGGLDKSAMRRRLIAVGIFLAVSAAGIFGMAMLEKRLLSGKVVPVPSRVHVVLAEMPGWMPASLARQIAGMITPDKASFTDPHLPAAVHQLAMRNPWIRSVSRVSRFNTADPRVGLLEVKCEFRRPIARISTGGRWVYVDADAFVLPDYQTPRYVVCVPATAQLPARQVCYLDSGDVPAGARPASIHYVQIEGVDCDASPPPPPGARWAAAELAEGLKLARVIAPRPYANQITTIDVRNHQGRINRREVHLRMYAQIGQGPRTEIRFGRFPNAEGDYEIDTQRKLGYLDKYCRDNGGQLAGLCSYLDLRYDQLHASIN